VVRTMARPVVRCPCLAACACPCAAAMHSRAGSHSVAANRRENSNFTASTYVRRKFPLLNRCGHCKQLAPEYERTADSLDKKFPGRPLLAKVRSQPLLLLPYIALSFAVLDAGCVPLLLRVLQYTVYDGHDQPDRRLKQSPDLSQVSRDVIPNTPALRPGNRRRAICRQQEHGHPQGRDDRAGAGVWCVSAWGACRALGLSGWIAHIVHALAVA
jgi:hypothetical protein